jgi:large subunit ribosomal protein L5
MQRNDRPVKDTKHKEEKAHKAEHPVKVEKAVKADKSAKAGKPVTADKPVKTDKPVKAEKKPVKPAPYPRLKEKYYKEVVPALTKDYSYKNVMQVPKVTKVVVNVGLGEATQNIKLLEAAQKELSAITGQKAVQTKAKKSIAGFKLRQGMPIGCKVTLRGVIMYEFLDRFISLALPRVRDFRGVSAKSFDGRGNYSIGIKEQFIFPEIEYDKVDAVHGLDLTICTTANTDKECRSLLAYMGMPFRK